MRRQKSFKNIKVKMPSFLEGLKKIIWKSVVVTFTVAIFLLVILASAKVILYRSEYFKLKAVESKEVTVDELTKLYKDRNVFTINLKDIERSMKAAYPDASQVRAKITLPDKITVSVKFRKPLAVIKNFRYHPVDEEGVVLLSTPAKSLEGLPVITGAEPRSKNLRIALDLLKSIRKRRLMARYGVITIDAHDIRSLSFYLKNGLEVKIGYENFAKRLALLEKTLKDPRLLVDKIKYIDVRFDDVVVSPK